MSKVRKLYKKNSKNVLYRSVIFKVKYTIKKNVYDLVNYYAANCGRGNVKTMATWFSITNVSFMRGLSRVPSFFKISEIVEML